jgi:asparagine synthase (glutamine-hydrolysing)
MSAICGVVGLDGRLWSSNDLTGVLRALRGLGQDGEGEWAGRVGRCGVALAAALRHSTTEDRADRQPVVSPDGSIVLVADLRLDNRAELAASLGLADGATTPDSAYLLAGYERWGEAALDRIQGEFAFALADGNRGGVLLARDHVGARPLVVHERRGVLAFASTALALTGLEGVGHQLDMRRAAEVLALVYSSERTFVEGVRWVPPAGALWIDDSGVRRRMWWQPDPSNVIDLGSPAAQEADLRVALEAAVAARLRSTGAVGAMVSGGLDSTAVAATAARQLAPDSLRTYTAAPPFRWSGAERANWDVDESALVLELAERYPNIVPSFVHVGEDDSLFARHEPLWELGGVPPRNPCNWLWYHEIVLHAQAHGVAAVLSGTRGNPFFSADGPDWLVALLRRGRVRAAIREAIAWSESVGRSRYRTVRAQIVARVLPTPVRRFVRGMHRRPNPVDEWTAQSALRRDLVPELELPRLLPMLQERRLNGRRLALWELTNVAGQVETTCALTALTGVEERDPTGDRRVVEAAMRQPEWSRRRAGIGRAVARGAMADRLPAAIAQRTRRGEQLPDWLDVMIAARKELEADLDALVEHPTSYRLIDTERLRLLLAHWPERTASTQPIVVRDYRIVLLRALLISRYLRWFEARAARPDRQNADPTAAHA